MRKEIFLYQIADGEFNLQMQSNSNLLILN